MTVDESRGVEKEIFDNFPVGMRVLAVDDDPMCLKLLDTLLRKCHYHVTVTNQATMALTMLRENKDRFDVVISDVHMPDMDGFKLLEFVGLEMDLPVIMLSVNSDTNLVMKGVTHGACDYLVKPVRIEELKNIWQHVIRRKKFDSKNHSFPGDQDNCNYGSEESRLGEQLSGPTEQNEILYKRRKDEEDESENRHENEDPTTQKKPRIVWSLELHRKFVAAVNQLDIDKALPKRILDLMNVEGLTRENVASHLQKYRLSLKRISLVSNQQANMVTAFGGNDSAYMHQMGSLDGFGNFQRYNHATLSSYTRGSNILGRLNSSSGVSLQNLNLSGLVQPSHAQALGNSIGPLGNLNSNAFLLGVPSLDLDQLQHSNFTASVEDLNPLDNSRLLLASSTLAGPGSAIGSSVNAMIQQGQIGERFGNSRPVNMTSLSSEPLNTGGQNGDILDGQFGFDSYTFVS